MASVWKRLQRVNKRAAKFQYTASYHRIDLETTAKWKPKKLSVVWTRRSRRVATEPLDWEPSLKDPLKGSVQYVMPENKTVAVTLFKDSRTNELEDKDWTFVLEDVSSSGKRRRLAACAVNMRKYASLEPSQRSLVLPLTPSSHKIVSASIRLTLHCVLLREGQATDEDMQSLASLLSVNNNSDIAVLEDLDEDDYSLSDHSTRQMSDFRQQMEEMTHSLTNSDIAATPNSVQSLNFDTSRTPTAPSSPFGTLEDDATPTAEEPKSRPDFLANLTNLTKLAKAGNGQALKSDPKFTSTPNKASLNPDLPKIDSLKGVVFKPITVSKYNLKPLEFKTNLNRINLDRNDNQSKTRSPDDKTPVNEIDKLFPGKLEKDKTPVQDLLEWCQTVTAEYRSCRVLDLSGSWRSGLAFCAIIHHFRPDLIDFSGLQPDDPETNIRIAFEASSRLGVSQVLTAADVIGKPGPDKLAIMTYLFQLRAHFTGSELQVEQLGNDETESSYLVGRHDTDGSLPAELFSREVNVRRSRHLQRPPPGRQESSESRESTEPAPEPQSPTAAREVRDLIHQSKTLLGKVLSPSIEVWPADEKRSSNTKWFTDPLNVATVEDESPPARPEKLMTRKELTDPFGSDEEDEQEANPRVNSTVNGDSDEKRTPSIEKESVHSPLSIQENHLSSPVELPRPTPQLLSRHDELKEKARQLLEATKREARDKERIRRQNSKENEEIEINGGLKNGESSPKNKKPMTEAEKEERQAMLRERARKLIADARAGIVSPTSPLSPGRRAGAVEIISHQSVMEEIAAAGGAGQLEALLGRTESLPSSGGSRKSSLSPDRSEGEDTRSIKSIASELARRSPLRTFSVLADRLSPDKDKGLQEEKEMGSYIQSELEALEREQKAIDERAACLEKQLRRVMEASDDGEEESKLMSQWFNLVNKKNALIRRQMQLNILEQEEDLSRRCELLARELRLSLAVDEWRKTPEQKRRERLLLQDLVAAVNERDRLVQEMDEQEKAIADDDAIERNLSQVEIQRKNNCILQ